MSGWDVCMVHGPEDIDEESFEDLYTALEWARMRGGHFHRDGTDCLGVMKKTFFLESDDNTSFQYGTNYHWVAFTKKVDE